MIRVNVTTSSISEQKENYSRRHQLKQQGKNNLQIEFLLLLVDSHILIYIYKQDA